MQPQKRFITIGSNQKGIVKLMDELIFQPRLKAIAWSRITNQTPNLNVGYPGQHLASFITGMRGEATGARGNDIIDGTEVKSCSKIDQVDECKECKSKVLRIQRLCPICGSNNIDRKNDSKWLFAVKSVDELNTLVNGIDRILLIISYYPGFEENNFSDVKIDAYEIWPKSVRQKRFKELLTNYYNKIFLEHIKKDPNKTPAPKNFWPFEYQFYLCNPILVFSSTIKNIDLKPKIEITNFLKPDASRLRVESASMPSYLLRIEEFNDIISNASKSEIIKCLNKGVSYNDVVEYLKRANTKMLVSSFSFIDENLRNYLKLRDTDKISTSKKVYSRRVN